MGPGQMILIVAAMFLMVILAVNTKTMVLDSETIQQESESVTLAVALGQSMQERISARGYDDNYPGGTPVDSATYFVPYFELGPDSGEVAGHDSTFNDIDDFHHYSDSVSTPRMGKFYRSCSVFYVSESAPYDSTIARTFMKRVDVSITSPLMVDPNDPLKIPMPLVISRMYSYH